ncbi:MAG: DUF1080 domain-containing protein [Fuerstiella sp.]
MKRIMCGLLALSLPCLALAQDKKAAFLTPDDAGPDFDIQGEYSGTVGRDDNSTKIGIQVIALGSGKFRTVGYIGGLPGDGWDGTPEKRIPGSGQMEGDVCIVKADNVDSKGRGEIKDGNLTLYSGENVKLADFPRVQRESTTVGKTPPEAAIVLFDGTTADHFQGGRMSEDKLLMEGVTSKQKFGSYKLHLEFMLSFMPHASGQGRANSGCYQQGRYEVQILDSFGLEGRNNECGGVYEIADPTVNMCLPPLSWQTYDIEFHSAVFDDKGEKQKNAWMTVKHNGVVVHDKLDLPRGTRAAPVKEGPKDGPIYLQNHGNPIRFRNIWLVPIES